MEKIDNLNIIFLSNPNEVANRKSAIGSYVQSLCEKLRTLANIVVINPGLIQPKTAYNNQISQTNSKSPANQIIKKFIHPAIKLFVSQLFKIIKLKKNEKRITQEIKNNSFCIDFYCAYSLLVPKLKAINNSSCTIIYDAPIDEEYKFFYSRRIPLYNYYLRNEKKSLMAADFIIVYSPAVKDFLLTRHPELCDKQFRIHHNVDFSRLHFSANKYTEDTSNKDSITIGFVGSFLKWHRVDLLVKAFCILKNKYPNLKLILIGDGQELASIKTMVNTMDCKQDIHFTGFLDNDELLKAKEKIDIGVMPSSNWYGAPNKIFEYGAMSIACIAPKTPTIEYIFEHRKHLLLFENNNLETLIENLGILIQNGTTRQMLGQELYNYIESNYSPENTNNFYFDLINHREKPKHFTNNH